jgi:hypothetical protein
MFGSSKLVVTVLLAAVTCSLVTVKLLDVKCPALEFMDGPEDAIPRPGG